MKYTEAEIEELFSRVLREIENGRPLRRILKNKWAPSNDSFYKWLESDKKRAERYARACRVRADSIFNEMLDIADDSEKDSKEKVQRDRLRIDTRKWHLSKLYPDKYGDKLEVESTNKNKIEFINVSKQFPDEDYSDLL